MRLPVDRRARPPQPPFPWGRRIRRAAILCSLALPAAAAAQSPVGPDLTLAQARADLDFLQAAILEAHGAPFRFSTRADFARRFDGYRARLTGDTPRLAFLALVAEAMADLRDGHARAGLDADGATIANAAPVLPLRLVLEGERAMVLTNDTPDDRTIRPGMELVSINGRPMAEVLRAIRPTVPVDGFSATDRPARLAGRFGASYWLFVEPASRFTVVARDAEGRTVTATLDGIREADRTAHAAANPVNATVLAAIDRLEGPRVNVAFRWTADSTVGVLRVRAFQGDDFLPRLDSVMARVHANAAVRGLVLDLRGNGGGVDMQGAGLVGKFARAPFAYFDSIKVATIAPSFTTFLPATLARMREGTRPSPGGGYLVLPVLHPGVSEQPPAADGWRGPLVVLMDGRTFSTAADVTATLHGLGRATFIGEESGGAYEGNTSGSSALAILPNSRFRVTVQMYGYYNHARRGTPGRGTLPDITLPRTVADLLAGRDPALERAVELAGRP